MTTLRLEDLPIAADQPLAPAAGDDAVLLNSRRTLLQTGMKIAIFAGLWSLGIFKSARPALAELPPYNEIANAGSPFSVSACGTYDPNTSGLYAGSSCQDNMCVGTSYEFMDRGFCTGCSEINGNNPYQWHFTGFRSSYEYRDYPGNICVQYGTPADAWTWSTGNCYYCSPALWRCHDGQKRDSGGSWGFTICEGLKGCNGVPFGC